MTALEGIANAFRLCARAFACVTLLFLAVANARPAHAQDVPRLLVLFETDSRLPISERILTGIADTLGTPFMTRGETYIEYLDIIRFSSDELVRLKGDILTARYGGQKLDAVVTIGPNALDFFLARREAIAPGAPVVFGAVTVPTPAAPPLPTGVTGVYSTFDPVRAVAFARQLQPDADRLVVITGSAPFDLQWQETATALFGDRYEGLPVTWISNRSIGEINAEVSRLDPRSIVLVLTVFRDSTGRRFVPREAVRMIATASAAPVYGVYDTYLGSGIVGGVVDSSFDMGQRIGGLIAEIAAGKPLSAPVSMNPTPTVDWNALRRWNLPEGRLPEGTDIRFREPTLLERYRVPIIATAIVVVAQALTIAALIAQRILNRRTRETLELERQELFHLSRSMQLGQLSGALAHEINQPLAAILANAEAGSRMLAAGNADPGEIRAILSDIAADDRRAAAVIAELRRLLTKGETQFDTVDLNEVVSATLALAASGLTSRGVRATQSLAPGPLPVRGNRAQLQQIVLNLAFNAADAMEDMPRDRREIRVGTRALPEGGAELSVADNGPGIDPAQAARAFDPFITTKAGGLGLGLSISRTIAQAHGGTLAFDPSARHGARIMLSLPQGAAGGAE